MSTVVHSRFAPLRARVAGAVIEPGEPRWPQATLAWQLVVNQEPAAVAVPADERDVIAIVDFAREHGLQVAPQRTGHNAAPLGDLEDVILVRTDELRGVDIDAGRRVARVRAGAKWRDVIPAASDLGLAAPHGSTGDVSVAGYVLGGGVGWYARRHGLAANAVMAIEVVTPDGVLRRVDADHEPELFWALRGGGGNFGIVTAIEIRLLAVAEVYAGVLFFEWERAAEVLHAWGAWTQTVPEEVTSVGRLLQFPPIPDLPPHLSAKRYAAVDAVVIGDAARGAELLAPLRALGPVMDTFASVAPAAIAELHMDPQEPVAGLVDSQMLGGLDAAGIDAFLAAAGPGSGSRLIVADIRHVGGALRRPAAGQGALGVLDAEYLTLGVGMAADPGMRRATEESLAALRRGLTPWDTGRGYANFAERRQDPARFFGADAYRRLRVVRRAIDPGAVMRANHVIPPA